MGLSQVIRSSDQRKPTYVLSDPRGLQPEIVKDFLIVKIELQIRKNAREDETKFSIIIKTYSLIILVTR